MSKINKKKNRSNELKNNNKHNEKKQQHRTNIDNRIEPFVQLTANTLMPNDSLLEKQKKITQTHTVR